MLLVRSVTTHCGEGVLGGAGDQALPHHIPRAWLPLLPPLLGKPYCRTRLTAEEEDNEEKEGDKEGRGGGGAGMQKAGTVNFLTPASCFSSEALRLPTASADRFSYEYGKLTGARQTAARVPCLCFVAGYTAGVAGNQGCHLKAK